MSQADEREEYLDRILQSESEKKIIVAGPGTGKTYTFGQLLKEKASGNNIAMTFINGLVNDMSSSLGAYAEVRTFHSYCKMVLHKLLGGVTMAPYLDKIIESDAVYLELSYNNILPKFQRLETDS
ncbi:hypothetical protein KJ644_04900, partial [Candidatus Dependentiae bacterium]|nr:hypothetical protein [Candidatus Dependentiae bacterium]